MEYYLYVEWDLHDTGVLVVFYLKKGLLWMVVLILGVIPFIYGYSTTTNLFNNGWNASQGTSLNVTYNYYFESSVIGLFDIPKSNYVEQAYFNLTFKLANTDTYRINISVLGVTQNFTITANTSINITANLSKVNYYLSIGCQNNTDFKTKSMPRSCERGSVYNTFYLYFDVKTANMENVTTTVSNLYLNYSYGVDNCSNSFNIPSNATALNVSFKDTVGATQLVNLTTTMQYGTVSGTYVEQFYQVRPNISTNSYCIYPAWGNISTQTQFRYTDVNDVDFYYMYYPRLYNVTQNLSLYVTPGSITTFTLKDKDTGQVLENVLCTSYIQVGGVYNSVESKLSDITGRIQFVYVGNENYKYYCSKSNYNDLIFYLTPVTSSAYDVPMEKIVAINESIDYDRIAIRFYADQYRNNAPTNFTFIISSLNELTSYGYNISYPGGYSTNSGTNAVGEQFNSVFNINGATQLDRVKLYYYYTTTLSGLREFTNYYAIQVPSGNATNTTMMTTMGQTYGLGIFERMLIAVCIAIFATGLGALVGQLFGGFAIGLLSWGYLVFVGFLPIWVVIGTIIIGALILLTKEGT